LSIIRSRIRPNRSPTWTGPGKFGQSSILYLVLFGLWSGPGLDWLDRWTRPWTGISLRFAHFTFQYLGA